MAKGKLDADGSQISKLFLLIHVCKVALHSGVVVSAVSSGEEARGLRSKDGKQLLHLRLTSA